MDTTKMTYGYSLGPCLTLNYNWIFKKPATKPTRRNRSKPFRQATIETRTLEIELPQTSWRKRWTGISLATAHHASGTKSGVTGVIIKRQAIVYGLRITSEATRSLARCIRTTS